MKPVLAAALAATAAMATGAGAEETTLTLLSMNMYGAGANDGKGIGETVAVMKATGADIIAAVETAPEPKVCDAGNCIVGDESRAREIAAALGYYYHDFRHNTDTHWADALLSRYPIGKETPNGAGVEIDVNGRKVVAYAMNLPDAPYQPYQLLGIEYGPYPFLTTADEAVRSASDTRGKALAEVLADIGAEKDAAAQFVMGDFNEPSHLDWTERAVAAKLQPMAAAWPFTLGIEKAGFVDAFRATFPDEVAKPGITWTPTTEPADPTDHHDRIDYILVGGAAAKVLSAGVVGEKEPEADLVVTPWPADHRAVMAKVSF